MFRQLEEQLRQAVREVLEEAVSVREEVWGRAEFARLAAAGVALGALEVGVISVRHASGPPGKPAEDTVLGAGDTLVLSGLPEALALAEQRLLRG